MLPESTLQNFMHNIVLKKKSSIKMHGLPCFLLLAPIGLGEKLSGHNWKNVEET